MAKVSFCTKIITLVILGQGLCAPVFAFENIEADAAYERSIREKIQKEYSQGLKMLKVQADGLKMEVREKDILALQDHMYSKALMMGQCFDKATSFRKTVSDRILFDKYVNGCVEAHMKFIGRTNNSTSSGPFVMDPSVVVDPDMYTFSRCMFNATSVSVWRHENAPYDFLDVKSSTVRDFVAMKKCYEAAPKTLFPGYPAESFRTPEPEIRASDLRDRPTCIRPDGCRAVSGLPMQLPSAPAPSAPCARSAQVDAYMSARREELRKQYKSEYPQFSDDIIDQVLEKAGFGNPANEYKSSLERANEKLQVACPP
jgi:hypothetical protein